MTIGIARACPPFTLGFDSFAPVSLPVARAAKAAGHGFAGRYVENLTSSEIANLFAEGLGILPLTEAITSVALTDALGAQIAGERARELQALGCPPTVHLWTDHESPAAGSASMAYLAERARATIAAGFGPGLYGGEPFDLTGAQMYSLAFNRYFRGGGSVPEPRCGFCVLQLPPLDQTLFGGQRVDVDVVCEDFDGRTPILWWPT